MKRMKRAIALLLCALMLTSAAPFQVFAQEQDTTQPSTVAETTVPETTVPETTVPETTVPETTVPETTAPETTVPETTAPETTVPETSVPETTVPETTVSDTTAAPCEECGQTGTHDLTCSRHGAPQVGEQVWIPSGVYVYEQAAEENGHLLRMHYQIQIQEILTDGSGVPAWYRFDYVATGIVDWITGGLVLNKYRYVRVADTVIQEPASQPTQNGDAIPACDCDSEDADLSAHPASCARRSHIQSMLKNNTAQELFQNWENYDEATQQDILNMAKAEVKELYSKLKALLNGDSTEGILSELEDLERTFESVTKDTCEAFYDRMMELYSKAFDNDRTIVTGEEMQRIDKVFSELQKKLYKNFGYSNIKSSVMSVGRVFASTGKGNGNADGSLALDKNIAQGTNTDYLLTLESYVTGYSQDYIQPVDLVVVLDQSASMYAPMGLAVGLNNKSLYTDSPSNLIRYAMDAGSGAQHGCIDLKAQLSSTEKDSAGHTFKERIGQLGYLVAQSRSGGSAYCTEGHSKHTDSCKTYDWFVVKYVEGDAKPWKMYRIKHTACPSGDGYRNHTYTPLIVEYNDKEIGESHFYFYKSQTGALYDSITAFAAALKATNANHRLAIAGFAAGNQNEKESNVDNVGKDVYGSGIYVDGKFIKYNSVPAAEPIVNQDEVYSSSTITPDQYASALMDVQTNYDGILASLKAVKTDYYYTYQNVGFDIALNILKNATDVDGVEGVERKKIVVLFTDGEPSMQSLGGEEIGNYAIERAAKIKEQTNAEIYTVCTSTLEPSKRAFLTYSSSDYPGAKSLTNPGASITVPKYAKTAESATELVNQFLSIVEDVGGAYINLGKEAVLQDMISEYFALPDVLVQEMETKGSISDETMRKYIQVYTSDYNGSSFGAENPFTEAEIEVVKGTDNRYSVVQVSNFDYSENFVSANGRGTDNTFFGRKLVVKIAVDIADGNKGGNYLPSNVKEKSGIFVGAENLEEFPVPHADVPTVVVLEKKVVGDNADYEKKFQFEVSEISVTGFQKKSDENSYLEAVTDEAKMSLSLADGESGTLEKVKVGTTLTITEQAEEFYTATIKVLDAEGREITPTKTESGMLEVTVVPGMKIVYTNTITLADLIIEKTGISDLDHHVASGDQKQEQQSTVFTIKNDAGFEMQVAIVGNETVTIKNIPVGTYTVTEDTNWSWRYTPKKNNQSVQVKATGENKLSFANERVNKSWLSGDSFCKNWWISKEQVPENPDTN